MNIRKILCCSISDMIDIEQEDEHDRKYFSRYDNYIHTLKSELA